MMPKRAKKLTPAQIENLYEAGDHRLVQERNDFLLPQICDFVREKKWLNLRPEYQRRLVWERKKKSLFIESLLMNIPVPPIFLFESDLSRYEVMDGQQRLNAILEFYDNSLVLHGLETWSPLNGMTYKKCPTRIQRGFDRRRVSATILLAESAPDAARADEIKRQVFERLNTGGQTLNPQELRNAIYASRFNEMINTLASLRQFNEAWGIPPYEDHYQQDQGYISQELAENKLFKRMVDCEIVLRFFAFRTPQRIKGSVRSILDSCMRDHLNSDEGTLARYRNEFTTCLNTACAIFQEHTFQIPPSGEDNWRHSQPLYDAVMVSIDRLRDKASSLVQARQAIMSDLVAELRNERAHHLIIGSPNTAVAIKSRIDLVHSLMKRHV
jgi:hypothetical protein